MKNCLHFIFLVTLITCLTGIIHAQDLTGIWRGHFRSNEGFDRVVESSDGRYRVYDDRYKMELQIAQTHNHFEAITYSYKNTEFYGKAEASGSLNEETKKVLLKEGKLLEVRYANGTVCIMTCFLQYSKLGNDEYLQGTYYSTSVNDSSAGCGKGSIFLHRVTESDFHKEPLLLKKEKELLAHKKTADTPSVAASGKRPARPETPSRIHYRNPLPTNLSSSFKNSSPNKTTINKKQDLSRNLPPGSARESPSHMIPDRVQYMQDSAFQISKSIADAPVPEVLKVRTNEILKTIVVNHSSVEIRIYDDGAIDNDTVSVYYDNKILISKARLSDQPITVKIPVEPSDRPHQLVMVAENLGDIPPNTSLLVVRDGDKRYEERIISTEQKNVEINFIYKKIE